MQLIEYGNCSRFCLQMIFDVLSGGQRTIMHQCRIRYSCVEGASGCVHVPTRYSW